MTTRRLVILVAGAVAAGALAPCGTAGTSAPVPSHPAPSHPAASGAAVFAAAYQHTSDARSAQISLTGTATVKGTVAHIDGTGAFTFSSPRQGNFDITTSAAGHQVAISERLVGDALYVKVPHQATTAMGGAQWIEITGVSTGASALTQDPSQALAVLAATSGPVSTVGPATVGGVATTEYRATVDVSKAAAQQNPQTAKLLKDFARISGVSSIPLTVWIDQEGRARQVAESFTVPGSSAAAGSTVDFTYDISNYGVPVNVVAPPPSEVKVIPVGTITNKLGG